MGNISNADKWFPRCRLAWLERRALLKGGINRQDLIDTFGISPAAASGDLQAYQALNPGALAYNLTDKYYAWQPGASLVITPTPWAKFPY